MPPFFLKSKLGSCSVIFIMGMLLVFNTVKAEDIGTLTSNVTVKHTPPTCYIDVPREVKLGELTHGDKVHPEFKLVLNCQYTTKTFITAKSLGPVELSDSAVMTNGSKLQIREYSTGGTINLQGSRQFCVSTGSQSCYLTPVTKVRGEDKIGKTEVVISFEVGYK